MTLRSAALLAVLVHAVPAAAEFEGVAEVEMTVGGEAKGFSANGHGTLYVSRAGWRMEMVTKIPSFARSPGDAQSKTAPQEHKSIMFGKSAAPGKSWFLNESAKTYSVHQAGKETGADDSKEWKVSRLGSDSVAGVRCTNVRAERDQGNHVIEACLATDFFTGKWFEEAGMEKTSWMGAAMRAGVKGYPVRMVSRSKEGAEKFRMQLVKIERRSVPASMFEVPSGYKESRSGSAAMDPERQRRLEEAMKNMTPEQRKRLEEAMKKMGAQGQ